MHKRYIRLKYFQDYCERFPELELPRKLSYGNTPLILIEGTQEQIDHVIADARYYAGDNMDACPPSLRKNAKLSLHYLTR